MRSRAGPVTEISVFATDISGTGMKIFPYEHYSPVTGTRLFKQNSVALTTYRPKWHNFGLVSFGISSLGVCELALLVKLQDSRKLWQSFMFHHFGCVSWIHPGRPGWNFPYEHTTEFVPVTEPACLPGLYQDALGLFPRNIRAMMAKIKLPEKPRSMLLFWMRLIRTYRDLSSQADPVRENWTWSWLVHISLKRDVSLQLKTQ